MAEPDDDALNLDPDPQDDDLTAGFSDDDDPLDIRRLTDEDLGTTDSDDQSPGR